jgi:lipid II isoglutaminyl synthase (glutamine-hydrolysing)
MLSILLIFLGKAIIYLSNLLNLGSGSTWPGHIALKLNKNFIRDILKSSNTKVVIVAGTNGKTTTARLITSIIREGNHTYLQNKAGANLINGLASTLIRGSTPKAGLNKNYLIFETDENALPEIVSQTNPSYIVCLNLFRDQLDRYGEVDSIARRWQKPFDKLDNKTTLILNADDAQIAYLGNKTKAKALFFGLDEKNKDNKIKHGADTTHCPKCSNELIFHSVSFSHIGRWSCPKCGLNRPNPDLSEISYYPLSGTYNKYNALAAALFAKQENIKKEKIISAFKSFTPAFGRQEKLKYKNKNVQLFLSKNPTSFNESLTTIKELGGKDIFILLNDRIPDGLDISWIWDINFEELLEKDMNIGVGGDRVFEMGLRLKYAQKFTHIFEEPKEGLDAMISELEKDETLYILPNYSAMLDIRKVITGKKIL